MSDTNKKRKKTYASDIWDKRVDRTFNLIESDYDLLKKMHDKMYPGKVFKKTRVIRAILTALLINMPNEDIGQKIYENSELRSKISSEKAFPFQKIHFVIKIEEILIKSLFAKFQRLKLRKELHTTLIAFSLIDIDAFFNEYVSPHILLT